MPQRLLIINIAGLGATAVGPNTPNLFRLSTSGSGAIAVQPPVPALTCPSQATLLTGSPPADHGIVSNGWYFRDLALVLNWQRSANLMAGKPIWETARLNNPELRCANLFWRYATHSSCDVNVVERPTYWADGRKSPDIYTEPGSSARRVGRASRAIPAIPILGSRGQHRVKRGSLMQRLTCWKRNASA